MKKIYIIGLLLLGFGASCQEKVGKELPEEKPSAETLINDIRASNDSLRSSYKRYMADPTPAKEINHGLVLRVAHKQVVFYQYYPKHKEAAFYLDNAFQLYTSEKMYKEASDLGQILIESYPKYKGRAMAIYNLAALYDGVLDNRAAMEKYYTLLLKDYPKLDSETRLMIEDRLKNKHLSQDELIELENK